MVPATNLVMDLTYEQGRGRETQVQPPLGVWEQFFGVSVHSSALPAFRLVNKEADSQPEQRKVVKHHHNLTLEIAGAKLPRPAILRMRRVDSRSFEYWVYRRWSKAYSHCNWLLDTFAERMPERRWMVF